MIVVARKPKPTRRQKPAPEIKQVIVTAYSPKRITKLRRVGRHPRDYAAPDR
jgi:hypothetical protein